jgi:hypothetical protein
MANKQPRPEVIEISECGFANRPRSNLSLLAKSAEFVNPKSGSGSLHKVRVTLVPVPGRSHAGRPLKIGTDDHLIGFRRPPAMGIITVADIKATVQVYAGIGRIDHGGIGTTVTKDEAQHAKQILDQRRAESAKRQSLTAQKETRLRPGPSTGSKHPLGDGFRPRRAPAGPAGRTHRAQRPKRKPALWGAGKALQNEPQEKDAML